MAVGGAEAELGTADPSPVVKAGRHVPENNPGPAAAEASSLLVTRSHERADGGDAANGGGASYGRLVLSQQVAQRACLAFGVARIAWVVEAYDAEDHGF